MLKILVPKKFYIIIYLITPYLSVSLCIYTYTGIHACVNIGTYMFFYIYFSKWMVKIIISVVLLKVRLYDKRKVC